MGGVGKGGWCSVWYNGVEGVMRGSRWVDVERVYHRRGLARF